MWWKRFLFLTKYFFTFVTFDNKCVGLFLDALLNQWSLFLFVSSQCHNAFIIKSLELSLKFRQYKSSCFVLFQDYFGYSMPLNFHKILESAFRFLFKKKKKEQLEISTIKSLWLRNYLSTTRTLPPPKKVF